MTVLVAPFPDGDVGVTITDSSLPAVTADDLSQTITLTNIDRDSVDVSGPVETWFLSDFTALYRATSIDPDTYTDGDDWPNEGTGGSAYDAQAATPADNPASPPSDTPHFVTSPAPGFEIIAVDVSYFFVPDGAEIKPGTGSFTAFGRFYWPSEAGAFDNIFAKINTDSGGIGSGGFGWQIASGTLLGSDTYAIIAGGGSSFGTDPVAANSGGLLGSGEHLVVMRVDRDTDVLDLFIDNVKMTGHIGSASTVPDVTAAHEWIFGRGTTQTNRAYGLVLRALSDTEITVDLPGTLYT